MTTASTDTLDVDPEALEHAMQAARLLAHVQGFELLRAASEEFGWSLDLSRIAEIWRAGCIIRSALLNDLADALRETPPDAAILTQPALNTRIEAHLPALRQVVSRAVAAGIPVPAFSALLAWYDTMRRARGTANLIQAQRDYFGAHGFARIDEPGQHHGDWTRFEDI